MNVYVHSWFGFKNLGDDLLCQQVVEVLEQADSVESITITAHDSESLSRILDGGLSSHPLVHYEHRSFLRLFTAVFSHDVLVIGPGGLFALNNFLKYLVFWCAELLWKLLGRKVVFFGVGVRPVQDKLSIALWRSAVRHSDLFIARDADMLEACGIDESERVFAAADLVFLRRPASEAETLSERDSNGRRRVAVAFANVTNGDERAFRQMSLDGKELVERLLARNADVDLLSFMSGIDEPLNNAIVEELENHDGVRVLSYDQTASASKDLAAQYDLVLGMRFHSFVLAIQAGVPVTGISYAYKIERLMNDVGFADHVVCYCPMENGYYDLSLSRCRENALSVGCGFDESKRVCSSKRRSHSYAAQRAARSRCPHKHAGVLAALSNRFALSAQKGGLCS